MASTAYVYALTGGMRTPLVVSQAVLVLLPLPLLFLLPNRQIKPWNLAIWSTLTFMLITNLLLNVSAYPTKAALAHIIATILGLVSTLFMLQWLLVHVPRSRLMGALAYALTPLILLAIGVSLFVHTPTGRASPFGLQPNWWGELAFAYTMCLLTIRSFSRKVVGLALAGTLLFLVQSRSGMLGAGVSMLAFAILTVRTRGARPRTRRSVVLALSTTLAIVAVLTVPPIASGVWHFLDNHVLLLNNRYRGIDTGFTHRVGPWEHAIQVAKQHPLIGAGFGTLDYVHNGFLQMAAEGGAPLLLLVVLLISQALADKTSRVEPERTWAILGYVAYVMFQPRMLNLDLASLVFFLALFRSASMNRPMPVGAGLTSRISDLGGRADLRYRKLRQSSAHEETG